MAERAECSRIWTEKIVKDTEAALIPNPGYRVEDFIFEKIDKQKPTRLSNMEYLGLDMIEAGGEFGQDTPYGKALIKTGQAEQKLGQVERDLINASAVCFTQPLRKFLEGEMKTIIKEKGILENKRYKNSDKELLYFLTFFYDTGWISIPAKIEFVKLEACLANKR